MEIHLLALQMLFSVLLVDVIFEEGRVLKWGIRLRTSL